MRTAAVILWLALVGVHHAVVWGNVAAFFVLPFVQPWHTALPLCSVILLLTFARGVECPLTTWENAARQQLGWPTIKAFIGHYYTWPIKRWLRG